MEIQQMQKKFPQRLQTLIEKRTLAHLRAMLRIAKASGQTSEIINLLILAGDVNNKNTTKKGSPWL